MSEEVERLKQIIWQINVEEMNSNWLYNASIQEYRKVNEGDLRWRKLLKQMFIEGKYDK